MICRKILNIGIQFLGDLVLGSGWGYVCICVFIAFQIQVGFDKQLVTKLTTFITPF